GVAVAFLAAPRFAPRWIMTVMLAMWSIALMPVVFFASLPVLIGSRLVLGASEGGGTPTALNMVHDWFPDDKRDFPASIV
ncbi:MFS transporter, partial [Klebsiella pneumoniae]